jgi:hypothetical protein
LCGTFSSSVGATEEIVLATERDDAQRPFGGVVVDLELAVVGVAVSAGWRERA